MKRYRIASLFFFAVSLFCLAAIAQEVGVIDQTPQVTVSPISAFLHNVFAFVASAAATALTAFLVGLAKKNGIQITSEQQDVMKEYSNQAIMFAEEWAAKLGESKNGAKKLEIAKSFLMSHMPKISEKQAEDSIHAALPESPFGAVSIDGQSTVGVDKK